MISKLKRIAKKLLAIPAVRKAYVVANRAALAAGGSTRLGATVHSELGLATFNREQWAVLAGRRSYYTNLRRSRTSHVELRRNVHRLEKGILMRPRRDVFARDYIGETVEFYAQALRREPSAPAIEPGELSWAHDVLVDYFKSISAEDPTVDAARAQFVALPEVESDGWGHPHPQGDLPATDIGYDQLFTLAARRRSVRWFDGRPVDRKLIDKALLVARQAPSACNRLPYEFLVYDDPALVNKVAAIPYGAAGYAEQIPTLIVVKGKLDSYFSPRDRHVPYIDASLAVMSFMFALETLGLSSSAINWPDFEPLERKMAATLGLAPHERVIILVAVGYADPKGYVAFSQKKDLDVLRTYNHPLAK